jgi:glyceraldehyde 3-phosphate dehydrogenase (phosphorylating)
MTIRIAINGYGRIGRNILRAHYEKKIHPEIQIVAINNLSDVSTDVYLTQYDTTHGKFPGQVSLQGDEMIVNGDRIKVIAERDPKKLPWKELNIDIVFECTGHFTSKEKAYAHIDAGAKKVIISAPATNVDATIVYGVNHDVLSSKDKVISNASCTTNCLATVVKPLHDAIGIVSGLMNTVHAFTNDQSLLDVYHGDLRRARGATQSIIPTKTGAASSIGLVMPDLKGKLDGFAVRVPTINVSLVDLTFEAKRATTLEEVNDIMRKAANTELKGILEFNDQPLVSVDFNHNPASAIFDVFGTKVIGKLVKVLAWYDNEWGFSNRMLDVAKVWMEASQAIDAVA